MLQGLKLYILFDVLLSGSLFRNSQPEMLYDKEFQKLCKIHKNGTEPEFLFQ